MAVVDGITRKSMMYVGDSMGRNADGRLNKDEDIEVCLPGARLE